MSEEKRWIAAGSDFCPRCRGMREFYQYKKRACAGEEGEAPVSFLMTVSRCMVCGEEMETEGLLDLNAEEYCNARCEALGLIKKEDLLRLMKLYEIGKAPLSLALGFGEITVTRWLSGAFPSKEYSDICFKAMREPSFMRKCLRENKEKLTKVCFQKADRAAEQLERSLSLSGKIRGAISEAFRLMGELTPLALQKLLYFLQGLSLALRNEPFYPEDCEAWVHGPVVRAVYELMKDFCFDPTEDPRFPCLSGEEELTEEERELLVLTLQGFGRYAPKVLEHVTHREFPWKKAREGLLPEDPGNRYLLKDDIKAYFTKVHESYELSRPAGIRRYVEDMMKVQE